MNKVNRYPLLGLILIVYFALFSFFVQKDLFTEFDLSTTVKIQNFLPSFVTTPFSVFSILGSAEIASLFLLVLFILISSLRKLYILFLYGLTGAIEIVGKSIISQSGPPVEFLKTNLHFGFPSSSISADFFSYPSGHVARTMFISAILVFTIYTSIKNRKSHSRFALPALALAVVGILTFDFIMFVSRVYLGEHWATDVLGGVLLGASLSFLSVYITLRNYK